MVSGENGIDNLEKDRKSYGESNVRSETNIEKENWRADGHVGSVGNEK